jgi:hypothetical protein
LVYQTQDEPKRAHNKTRRKRKDQSDRKRRKGSDYLIQIRLKVANRDAKKPIDSTDWR